MAKVVDRQVIQIDDGETFWVYAKDLKDAIKTLKKLGDFEEDLIDSSEVIPKKSWKKYRCTTEETNESITFYNLILASRFIRGEKSFLLASTMFS